MPEKKEEYRDLVRKYKAKIAHELGGDLEAKINVKTSKFINLDSSLT